MMAEANMMALFLGSKSIGTETETETIILSNIQKKVIDSTIVHATQQSAAASGADMPRQCHRDVSP